jgi:hypothetical protein
VCSSTDDTLASAKYNGSEKLLLSMVVNHHSMLQLLSTLGLLEKNTFLDAKTITLHGGRVLSSVGVVKQFGWSPNYFRHKCTWYGWVEEATKSSEWSGPIPGWFLFYFNLI